MAPHSWGVFDGDEEVEELSSAHAATPESLHQHVNL